MVKEKYPQKDYPGSKYPGIDDKDLIKVQSAYLNPWTGKFTPGKWTLPDDTEIPFYPW